MSRIPIKSIIFLSILLIFSAVYSPIIPAKNSVDSIEPNVLTSGSINGIDYSYGSVEFSASGNFTIKNEGFIQEFSNETTTTVRDIELFESFNEVPVDILYKAKWTEYTATGNSTYERRYNNATLTTFIDTLFATQPGLHNPTNLTQGSLDMDFQVTENVYTEETFAITTDGDFIGQFQTGVTLITYNHAYLNGTVTQKEMFLFAEVFFFEVTKKVYAVQVTNTKVSYAQMAYASIYSNVYNITASANQVNITNGENFAAGVFMFDNIQANYTEYVVNALWYNFLAIEVNSLVFANDTTMAVPWEMYPRNMLPVFYNASGQIIEAGLRQVTSELRSTFQAVTSAFLQVETNPSALGLDQTSIEARLAVWGLQSVTTMIAFKDGNENGRLDLGLNEEGLMIDSTDRVEYIGLAEAYQTTIINVNYRSHIYNESVQFIGLGVNVTNTNVNLTRSNFQVETYGLGDMSVNTQSNFFWDDPIVRTDGTVEFSFGVDYTDFPVTWVNMTNPENSFTEAQDIGYYYKILVNPTTGFVRISPTWVFGGIEDPGYKSAMNGLSLALIVKSEFFALRASYSATETNETVEASSTRTFARLRVSSGDGNATEVDVTGPKQYYLLNGTQNQTAKFDAITLVSVAGQFEGERTTPFESESSNTAGTAAVGGLVETLSVEFFYTASLIIISYPEWSGQSIVHDPDYNINYDPPKVQQTSSSSSETSSTPSSTPPTTSSTPSDTSSTPTSSTPPAESTPPATSSPTSEDTNAASAPALALPLTALIIGVMTLVIRKKRE